MKLALRMYFLVLYSLSPMQKGIQAGHASVQYAYNYGRTKLFTEFATEHKTWIILNGGTSRDVTKALENGEEAGTLNLIAYELGKRNMQFSIFREPDLNYALTAICFIADERVWNKELVPDFDNEFDEGTYYKFVKRIGGEKNAFLREIIRDKQLAV